MTQNQASSASDKSEVVETPSIPTSDFFDFLFETFIQWYYIITQNNIKLMELVL